MTNGNPKFGQRKLPEDPPAPVIDPSAWQDPGVPPRAVTGPQGPPGVANTPKQAPAPMTTGSWVLLGLIVVVVVAVVAPLVIALWCWVLGS